ncbi:enoyl-CoA hydratase [Marmoricola sp. Leaf446]|uniref:enoyl-CoA hydratase/isomerase family protein n=1 Tax=Marmoricola sp. Leaf446 TaxID=1736379 RepID=UPI0006FE3DEF|nr:enoyl-CoA hydratase/isomerase family protein [Marmoricola sp. Leaf446]KQT93525.1 enoyl-CoA hydratase [Marmoricola sp. Leaf446]
MDFDKYERLSFERRDNGVLLVTIDRPEKYNAADRVMLKEFVTVWPDISDDPETRVAVVTGAGKAFCAGGDLQEELEKVGDYSSVVTSLEEARKLVENMVNCDKPIISAINGPAAGAGLVVALMADISIIGEDIEFTDGHINIGLVAGDHAALIWPLLCGMAKAKYYLLTADRMTGKTADEIGLVSKAVPREAVLDEALSVANRLATGPQQAIKWTRRSLNSWLRMAMPAFEASLAMEMITLFSPDVREGISSFLERRDAAFE